MSYPTPNTSLNPADWIPNYEVTGGTSNDDIVIGQLSDFPALSIADADATTGKIQSVVYAILDTLYRNSLNNVGATVQTPDVFYVTKSQNSADLNNILTTFSVNFKMRVDTDLIGGTYVQKIEARDVVPSAPSGLTAINTSSTANYDVELDWDAESTGDAVRYMIYRTANTTPPAVTVEPIGSADAPTTSYTDQDTSAMVVGRTYYYWVRAWNPQGYSDPCAYASVVYSL
jgi:hypothetical protein